MFQSGFLGTNATFVTDATLIAEILFFIAICAGVVAQRRGRYTLHDWIQTPVVVLNLFLISFVMVTSFIDQRVATTLPQRPGDAYYLVVGLHAVFGVFAEGLAIYALLAGHNILPRRIGRLRYWMWATFGFWTAALVAGMATYYVWYVQPAPVVAEAAEAVADAGSEPVVALATDQVFLQNFVFAPTDLTISAGTEVVWVNQDGAPHNVTIVDAAVASENFFQGEAFSTTFSEPGTYTVYCSLHGSPDGSGMTMTVHVLEEGAELAVAADSAPPPNPTPPTPTPAPAVPPPPADLLEAQEPQQRIVGLVSFFDTSAPSDSANVILNGIPAPSSGSSYEAWLTDGRTNVITSLGQVHPDENGHAILQMTDAEARNLLALYDGFQLTEEPQFDDNPAPGTVLYSGQHGSEALSHIRAITAVQGNAPAAYGLGARRQAEELLRHVEYVQTAYELLSIADAQRHTEHIVNVLQGAQGEHFGDLDNAHGIQNPGDGYGVLPYVLGMQEAAVSAANAPDSTEAIRVHAGHVVLATDNALLWGARIEEAALQILAAESVGDIGLYVQTLTHFSNLLLNGADDNGDGNVAPAEGGIFTAYQHAQYMAAVPISGE